MVNEKHFLILLIVINKEKILQYSIITILVIHNMHIYTPTTNSIKLQSIVSKQYWLFAHKILGKFQHP